MGRRERMACLASMGRMALLVSLASRVPRGSLGCLVLQAIRVLQACLAAQGPRVELELRVNQAPGDMLEWLAPLDLRVSLVFRVRQEWRVFLDRRVTADREGWLDHRGRSGTLEAKEREDPWASQGLKASQEPRETRDSKEKLGRRETLVTQVLRAWVGRKVKRACLENQDLKDSKE